MKKNKQEIICTKVMADLTSKGYSIFTPLADSNIPFDFIAYNHEDEYYRIKVECSLSGYVPTKINKEIDYYALYLSDIDTIVYPSNDFSGEYIMYRNNVKGDVYWYKDFLDLTNEAEKHYFGNGNCNCTCCDYSTDLEERVRPYKAQAFDPRKNKKILQAQVDALGWTGTGRLYGVSDNAVRYWYNKLDAETTDANIYTTTASTIQENIDKQIEEDTSEKTKGENTK